MDFTEIDAEKIDWGETVSLPIDAWNVFADPNGGGFYLFGSSGTIYR